jgi:23S rRNA (cytidine1920-2'-O)/16S rRNA (cytidine1409-2'-O)-methyltransferase
LTRRRLDAELVHRELAETRAAAQRLIAAGLVEVDGNPSPKPATMVDGAQGIRMVASDHPFVGRGGVKLAAALDAFPVVVAERRAIDVGASTGGFTDCLLQRGASSVVALDVGYGQLDWGLRQDDRVTVVERTNVRHADPAVLGAPFDIVVADLSFIGIATVAVQLARLGGRDTDHIVLVKPQFEAGRGEVGKRGIVRDPEIRAAAVLAAVGALEDAGLVVKGCIPSPITGAKGNREYLLWLRRDTGGMSVDAITELVRAG